MKRGKISNILRKLGLLYPLDKVRFKIEQNKQSSSNKHFIENNPNVILPPDYLMYESFKIDYEKYFYGGKETAEWILSLFRKHINLTDKNILDWGCGPGRIIRHIPMLMHQEVSCYGTDYNKKSIQWCKEYIEHVKFNHNKILAELPYETNFFNGIYGLSVLTHLSEKMHYEWVKELTRVLQTDGILILTTQGENYIPKLTSSEQTKFKNGKLVVRGQVKEGHRTFSAFHPDQFLKNLFEKHLEIVEKIVIQPKSKEYSPQDVWILKKN